MTLCREKVFVTEMPGNAIICRTDIEKERGRAPTADLFMHISDADPAEAEKASIFRLPRTGVIARSTTSQGFGGMSTR
jgi:hypothetical protein